MPFGVLASNNRIGITQNSTAAIVASPSVFSITPLVQLDFEGNLTNAGARSVTITQTSASGQSYVTGKIGSKALQFYSTNNNNNTNGTKSYITIAVPNLAPPFTITMWLYLIDTYSGNNSFMEFYSAGAGSGASIFTTYNSNSMTIGSYQASVALLSGGLFPVGAWIHLGVVVNSTTSISTYGNGFFVGTGTAFDNVGNQLSSSPTTVIFNLGWAARQATQYGNPGFSGVIDQFALFDVALTSSQIENIYRKVTSATGTYTTTTYGSYSLYIFTAGTGTITFNTTETINVLLVGGGGGGGGSYTSSSGYTTGCGGGGGGVGYGTINFTAGETYTITVGTGGVGGYGNPNVNGNSTFDYAHSGNDTTISGNGVSETAFGGGLGMVVVTGYNGGSGGSGGSGSNGGSATKGSSSTTLSHSVTYYGNAGGNSYGSSNGGGGGGGAGSAGVNVVQGGAPGNGGNGIVFPINSQYYGGGGGGGVGQQGIAIAASGGTGGGGAGGLQQKSGSNGTANTGGGGGGSGYAASVNYGGVGGTGGSGVVIFAIPI